MYGSDLRFTTENLFGITVAAFLEKPLEFHKTKEELRCRTDRYTEPMTIQLHKSFLSKRRSYGFDISDASTISFNKLFETRFNEDLLRWCELGVIYKVEYKKNIEDFCMRHKIELEYDITFEAIKKKEYRFRKKSAPQVSRDFRAVLN